MPASSPPSLSVVVPVYRDAERLSRSLPVIRGYFDSLGTDHEIIVVDDGSRDGAESIAVDNGALFISTSRRRGKGYCVRLGVERATREWTLVTDVDLSVPIHEFEKLWSMAKKGFSIVVASRRADGARIVNERPFFRRMASGAYLLLSNVLLPHGVSDPQCGFKLLHTDTARAILEMSTIHGYSMDTELLFLASRMGVRVGEVGVEWSHDSCSRLDIVRDPVRMLVELLGARIRHSLLSRASAREP